MHKEEWWNRLVNAIKAEKEKGRSYRSLSTDAGLGVNNVSEMIRKGKMPAFDHVLKLCRQLGLSVTYIVTGSRVEPLEEELLELFGRLTKEERNHLVELLRARRRTGESRE